MKEFSINTKGGRVDFSFPTSLEELNEDYLKNVTESITVAPNHSLIGLVYHERLASLIVTCRNKKKNASIGVVPIFIKSGGGDSSIVDGARMKQKLLIPATNLELAYHCSAPANKLTLDYFANIVDSSEDKDLYQKALADKDQKDVFFIEFKAVPNCNIIALYGDAKRVDNPYIKVVTKE